MLTLTLTAAELKEMAYNPNAPENDYLWNDGAETWTLENLADELEDEALEGMGEDSTITLTAVGLSEDGEREFVQGFCNAAPDWYVENGHPVDCDVTCPWCMPWIPGIDYWFKPEEMSAYKMGEYFYNSVADEMETAFAE